MRVLDDRHAVALSQRQQFPPHSDRQRRPGRVVEGRVRINQLRPVTDEQILELVAVAARDVPADQLRAGRAERLDGAEVSGAIQDDRVPGSTRHRASKSRPCCAPERISTLSARHAVAVGDRAAQRGLSVGRAVAPDREGIG